MNGEASRIFAFRLLPIDRILPNPQMAAIKIPDATPEIVAAYALSDEQALLAKVRYNRLLDIFLGVAAYSLQNHLRKIGSDTIIVTIRGVRGHDRTCHGLPELLHQATRIM